MKLFKTIQYICGFLLLQIFIEGLITFGQAFEFEKYNVFGWIIQFVITTFTITLSIREANDDDIS